MAPDGMDGMGGMGMGGMDPDMIPEEYAMMMAGGGGCAFLSFLLLCVSLPGKTCLIVP